MPMHLQEVVEEPILKVFACNQVEGDVLYSCLVALLKVVENRTLVTVSDTFEHCRMLFYNLFNGYLLIWKAKRKFSLGLTSPEKDEYDKNFSHEDNLNKNFKTYVQNCYTACSSYSDKNGGCSPFICSYSVKTFSFTFCLVPWCRSCSCCKLSVLSTSVLEA